MSKLQNKSNKISEASNREFAVGDTVIVHTLIQEDDRSRIQKFEGVVIAIKGSGVSKTFTVRKIAANDIGVERIFAINSPLIPEIEIKKKGRTIRSKLYYLRDRKGKQAMAVKSAL